MPLSLRTLGLPRRRKRAKLYSMYRKNIDAGESMHVTWLCTSHSRLHECLRYEVRLRGVRIARRDAKLFPAASRRRTTGKVDHNGLQHDAGVYACYSIDRASTCGIHSGKGNPTHTAVRLLTVLVIGYSRREENKVTGVIQRTLSFSLKYIFHRNDVSSLQGTYCANIPDGCLQSP